MNKLIQSLFSDFTVNGEKIPVFFLRYKGIGKPHTWVTWMQTDADNSLSGDDDLIGYVEYYDFDVYSDQDYTDVIESIKQILEANNFKWQPSRSSQDFYEDDTGYYHKTLSFAVLKEV